MDEIKETTAWEKELFIKFLKSNNHIEKKETIYLRERERKREVQGLLGTRSGEAQTEQVMKMAKQKMKRRW